MVTESRESGGAVASDPPLAVLVWGALRHRWPVGLAVTALCVAAAVAVALLMTPVYEARAVLMAADDGQADQGLGSFMSQFGGIATLAGLGGAKPVEGEAIATLKSRALIEAFVADENLLPVLFAERWDAGAERWLPGEPPPTLYDAYELFTEELLQVTRNLDEGTVIVSVFWRDPAQAAAWANRLVARLNDYMRERTISEASGTLRYLSAELERTTAVEIQQAIFRLIEANMSKIAMAKVREQFAMRVIDPAAPPDADAYVRPARVLLVAVGLGLGVVAWLCLGVLLEMRRGYAAWTRD